MYIRFEEGVANALDQLLMCGKTDMTDPLHRELAYLLKTSQI